MSAIFPRAVQVRFASRTCVCTARGPVDSSGCGSVSHRQRVLSQWRPDGGRGCAVVDCVGDTRGGDGSHDAAGVCIQQGDVAGERVCSRSRRRCVASQDQVRVVVFCALHPGDKSDGTTRTRFFIARLQKALWADGLA